MTTDPPHDWKTVGNPFGHLVTGACPCGLRVLLYFHRGRPVAWRFQERAVPIDLKLTRTAEVEGVQGTFAAVATCACGCRYRGLNHEPWIEMI